MWQPNRALVTAASLVLVAACGGGSEQPETPDQSAPGATTPIEAVEEVVSSIESGDFETAGVYVVPGQPALAALAEGASFADVAEALREGDGVIAANFWSGFAQGAGLVLAGTVTYLDGEPATEQGASFESVRVLPPEGGERVVWVTDFDGYRVDIFASFGAGLADKMLAPVERLIGAQTDDSTLILSRLRESVPSLQIAARNPGITTESRQNVLALVELITRVS